MDLVAAGLDDLHERIAGRFGRAEPRARVREYVSGLVTGLERKNGWTLAEWAGEVSPDGMQRRGVLPASQERGRARPVPGPHLAGLVRPHHLVNARPGLAGRQPGQGREKGIGTSDPGMIGYTLPEIRRLLVSLVQACTPDPEAIWCWSRWRRRRQYQARLCHYRRRGYALT